MLHEAPRSLTVQRCKCSRLLSRSECGTLPSSFREMHGSKGIRLLVRCWFRRLQLNLPFLLNVKAHDDKLSALPVWMGASTAWCLQQLQRSNGHGLNAQFHLLPSEERALEWLHPLGVRSGSECTFDRRLNQVNRAMSQSNSRAPRAQIVCETRFSRSSQPARAVLPHSGATLVSSSPMKRVYVLISGLPRMGGCSSFVPDKSAYVLTE